MSDLFVTNYTSCQEGLENRDCQLHLLLNSSEDIYILLDYDAKILYCNNSIIEYLGIASVDEIIGKYITELPTIYENESYFQRSVERYERLKAGEESFTEEDEITWPMKKNRTMLITHDKAHSTDGAFMGFVIILRDVTDERMHEENQRILERMNATQMACLVWDEIGEVVNCNLEALRLFGLSTERPEEEFGRIAEIQPLLQPGGMVTEEIRQEFIRETLSIGYAHVEVWLTKENGEPLPVRVLGVRVSWRYGHRLFAYLSDMSEEKAREAEAKDAEERVRIMFDSTPLICILRDENNKILECNKEALKLFGVSRIEELIRDFHLFYPEFQPDGRRSTEKANEIRQNADLVGAVEFEWLYQTLAGEPLPVEITFVPISWKGALCYLTYSRDLRKEKAHEQQVKESVEQTRIMELQKEKAQAASEAKTQFLASMSHEIRTPMNTIIGLLELMRKDNLDEEQTKQVKDIKHMSDILLQIINDILDFHKIESGKFAMTNIHFNFKKLFNDLVFRNQFLAESKGLVFESRIAPDVPVSVYGDDLRITQIITNLLTNAVKYTSTGYVRLLVDLAMRNGREYILITVEDSGIGIKKENFNILFEEFEQFDQSKNKGISGTGLGLPIAKRLAELMDGSIHFESEYGKGSAFTFTLPLIRGDIDQVKQTENVKRIHAKPDTKVLVVDDNEGNITVAVGLLARYGIIPQTAANGREAINMIKDNQYDLVFMDHMMPELDGVEATKIIRKLEGEYFHKLPIIALSANVVAGAMDLFLTSGMNDAVAKPIIENELNRALAKWLPEEKLETSAPDEGVPNLSSDESITTQMLEELRSIPDLSVLEGLARTAGDKQLYVAVLQQFCRSAERDVDALKRFAANAMWKDYTIRVHALKTVFANIGNHFMSDWASRLESAAAQGDIDKCARETTSFCNSMTLFHNKLRQTELMRDVLTKAEKTAISAGDLRAKLELLLTGCLEFQAEAAESVSKELPGLTFDSQVDAALSAIHDMVQSFDYDEAAEAIGALLQTLPAA
ncbi:MAG: PAS domain-containing protein [Clostridiales bacterium]|nr:PAS domain-containing protein [Clostridiales bacterium]